MRSIARKTRRVAAVGVAVLVFAAMPGVAFAQTDADAAGGDRPITDRTATDRPERDRDLGAVKERILNAINKRLEALERMSEAVASNENVKANHAAHLQNDYREATRILEDAADAVDDAETFAELREIVPAVFEETLVQALLKPKTHLVLASDSMGALYDRMEEFAGTLQSVIDRLAAQGYEMGAAQSALDEMVRLLEAAEDLAEPVADAVIGLDPGDWPEPAQSALRQGKADLEAARDLLRQARGQVREVVTAIREALSDE